MTRRDLGSGPGDRAWATMRLPGAAARTPTFSKDQRRSALLRPIGAAAERGGGGGAARRRARPFRGGPPRVRTEPAFRRRRDRNGRRPVARAGRAELVKGGRREVGVRWGGESGDRAKAGCGVWRNAAPASKAEGGRAAAASGPLRRSAGEQPGRRRHPSGLAGFCKNRFGPFEEGRGFSAAVGGGLPGFLASEADAKAPARITLRRAERRGRIFPRMRRWEIHSLREGRNWGKLIYIVSIEIL